MSLCGRFCVLRGRPHGGGEGLARGRPGTGRARVQVQLPPGPVAIGEWPTFLCEMAVTAPRAEGWGEQAPSTKRGGRQPACLSFPIRTRGRPPLCQRDKAEMFVLTRFLFLPSSLNCGVSSGRNLSLSFSFAICEMRMERVKRPSLPPSESRMVLTLPGL